MDNLILAVDNGYAMNENYMSFDIAQKEFLIHNFSLERVSTIEQFSRIV